MNGPIATTTYAARMPIRQASVLRSTRLRHLDIELTERCNNNCVHCYINLPADDRTAQARELSTDQVKDVLSQAAALGALSVCFTGGEPLLRNDLADIYEFARRLGLQVSIFTNGCLVTPALADLFRRIPPRQKIEVSVYGMERHSYEAVTRMPGSFDGFQRGLALLQERGVPVTIKSVLLPPIRSELADLSAWTATLPGVERPPRLSVFFHLRVRRDSIQKNRLIQNLRVKPEIGVEALRNNSQAYAKEMQQFCGKFMGPCGDGLFRCGAGDAPCIDAYGQVQPCLLLRHPETTYDLEGGSLQDALDGFFPVLRKRRASNRDYLARCARCFLGGLCNQCPGHAWVEHGELDTPVEYLCDVAHAQARDLGLVASDEKGWEVRDWRERVRSL